MGQRCSRAILVVEHPNPLESLMAPNVWHHRRREAPSVACCCWELLPNNIPQFRKLQRAFLLTDLSRTACESVPVALCVGCAAVVRQTLGAAVPIELPPRSGGPGPRAQGSRKAGKCGEGRTKVD